MRTTKKEKKNEFDSLSGRITGSRYIICKTSWRKRLRVLILNSYSYLKGDDTRFIYGAGITRPWPVMTAIPKRSFPACVYYYNKNLFTRIHIMLYMWKT